jgi:hypothetical protein
MSAALPQSPDQACCLTQCDEEVVVNIAGPAGADGAAGADGENGVDAFTFAAAGFIMPAEAGEVTVATTTETTFLGINQLVFVEDAGWMRVTDLPSDFSVKLRNEEDTGTAAYTENAAPGTAIGGGVKISPGGLQGPTGTAAGALLAANNLNDVVDPVASRQNLGVEIGVDVQAWDADLDTYATISPSANVQSLLGAANYAAMKTQLDLEIGTDVQAWDADLDIYAGITPSANIQALLGAATYAAARAQLSVLPRYGLLGSLIGADMNSAADQAITIASGVTKYIIRRIVVTNASISLTTAVGGIYGNLGKTAPVIVAAAQVYSGLTTSAKFIDLTLEAIVGTDILTMTTIYLSLTTPQGAAATASVFVFGEDVT